jgi:Domain of unknown function (DUF5666)
VLPLFLLECLSRRRSAWLLGLGVILFGLSVFTHGSQQPGEQAASSRVVGTIKGIDGSTITLTSDEGTSVRVTAQDSTRILRVAPGEKDLKNAAPARLVDLQAGDRILVRGKPSDDAHAITAGVIIVMKSGDVAATHEHQQEDWQKRGVGGLVSAVDPASRTITITVGAFGASRSVAVHTAKNTILRRYAVDSAKFDDAKPAPFEQIKVGDQLRARGTRSADGSELAAEEVVSGTFRNIAGPVTQVDTAANALTVQDAISKKSVVVKFSSDSQLRKLPEEFAQRIAMRLKSAGDSSGQSNASGNASGPTNANAVVVQSPQGGPGGMAGPGGMGRGRTPDFQQILSHMPAASLADLQKGEVVMLVSTAGNGSGEVTAITVLAGVDAILRASPNGASSMLSPWSLSAPSVESASP